jgi:hypothetical protein
MSWAARGYDGKSFTPSKSIIETTVQALASDPDVRN